MTDSLILTVFLIAIVFLSGALLAATPWFMKKNECFAVTIPESAQADVRFLAFRKRYAVAVLAVTLICAFALAIVSSVPLGKMGSAASAASSNAILSAAIVVAATVPPVVSFALMLHYRKRVEVIKREEGWKAERDEAVALIGLRRRPCRHRSHGTWYTCPLCSSRLPLALRFTRPFPIWSLRILTSREM